MAWTITVGGVNITAYVDVDSLEVEELAGQGEFWNAVCRFEARDHTGTIAVEEEDPITIAEGGTTYFAGKVKQVEEEIVGLTKVWRASAVSWSCLLDETAVDYHTIHAGDDDDVEIAAIFAAFRADINASTYVSQLETNMPLMALTALTLREAMEDICEVTGGVYWVDYAKVLHYVDPAFVAANATGWSDAPDGILTFGYSNFRRYKASDRLATRFFILGGADEGTGWVTGATYVAGDPEGVIRDPTVVTAAQRNQRGAALLEQYEEPRYTIEIDTTWAGFTVGEQHVFANATYGLSGATYVTGARWRFLSKAATVREFHVTLNVESMYESKWDRQVMAKLGQTMTVLIAEMGEWPAAVARNDMLLADATPAWSILSGPDAENEVLVATASPFTPAWRALTVADVSDLAYATPALTLGTVNAAGAAATVIRSDATILAFDATAPTTIQCDASAAAGSASVAARRDHTHAIVCAVAGSITPDASAAEGTATSFSRSDHAHGITCAAPTTTLTEATANAEGTATSFARSDHTHDIDVSASRAPHDAQYVVLAVDSELSAERVLTAGDGLDLADGGANGNATLTVDVTDLLGSGLTESSNNIDLNWGTPTIGTIQCDASADAGASTNPARSDHRHAIVCAAPGTNLSVSSANGEGTATSFARSDHAHAITSSSDPGAAASLLATDASGYLHLVRLYSDEYVTHEDDADTYLRFQADQITLQAGGADLVDLVEGATDYVNFPAGLVFINETSNAFMVQGLTVSQGANDGEIQAWKSSDVAHGMTDQAETDTYGNISKYEGDAGGLMITGLKDADGLNAHALRMRAFLGEAPQTTKAVNAYGAMTFGVWERNGTNVQEITTANANLFSWDTAGNTKMILDAEGDLHLDGAVAAFDAYDDVSMARALDLELSPDAVIRSEFDAFLRYGRADLEKARLVTFNPNGHHFVNVTQLQRLHNGAIWQLAQRLNRYERALVALGVDPALLEAQ